MKLEKFIEYLSLNDFQKDERGKFSKQYKIQDGDDNSERNKLTIQYKINKGVVSVYYIFYNKKVKRMKARLRDITIDNENVLNGFKILNKGE